MSLSPFMTSGLLLFYNLFVDLLVLRLVFL